MTIAEQFESAQVRVKSLSSPPDTATLLALYALFKQASFGDAGGKRPGLLDLRGRAKYDAWAAKKGLTKEAAMDQYIALVDRLSPAG